MMEIEYYLPNIVETDHGAITRSISEIKDVDTIKVEDVDWIRSSFLVDGIELDELDDRNRFYSTADKKFTDTSLGGNIAMNPRPQFTRYADIRRPGRISDRNEVSVTSITGDYGMGRYYSEAIDDNAEKIYLRFGVPVNTSLVRFLRNAIDPNTSYFVNTGRFPIAGMIGRLIGVGLKIYMFPVIGTLHTLFEIVTKFIPSASNKFYTSKPAMHMYWSTVNNIVSTMAIELGILPVEVPNKSDRRIGETVKINKEMTQELESLFPNLPINNGYVDVFAIASRTASMEFKSRMEIYKKYAENGYSDFMGFVYDLNHGEVVRPTNKYETENYLDTIFNFSDWYEKTVNNLSNIAEQIERNTGLLKTGDVVDKTPIELDDYTETEETIDPVFQTPKLKSTIKKSFLDSFFTTFDATIRDGIEWAILNVDYSGQVSESFSNSIEESTLKNQINSVSNTTRAIKFELGGALGDNIISNTVGAITNLLENTISEVSFGMSNIVAALLGGGYIDVPKVWSDSSASLPVINYNMRLISPYNHPVSLLQNIYIPIAMLLAGSLPRAVGKQSYTSPFLCSIYNRGKQNVELGIIQSLTITRGTSNLPFSRDGRALAVDVNFSVVDLSSVMYMPVDSGILFGLDTVLDEDNSFNKYINTITGKDLFSLQYIYPLIITRAAKIANRYHGATSPYMLGSLFGNSPLVRNTIGAFVSTNKIIPRSDNI